MSRRRIRSVSALDGESGPKDSADQVGVGAEVVEPTDVAGQERRLFGLTEVMTCYLGVAELLAGDVRFRQPGEDSVEGIRDRDHACTHTAPQPVIHSGTGS